MRKLLVILLLLFLVHGAWADVGYNLQDPYGDRGDAPAGPEWFIFLLCCMALSAFLVLTSDFIAWLKKNKPLNFTEKQKEKEELQKQIVQENKEQANPKNINKRLLKEEGYYVRNYYTGKREFVKLEKKIKK